MNPVRYIHPDAFKGLLGLQRLKLHGTQLHQLPSLQYIGHSLTHLELTHSIQFEGNHAHDFSYLLKTEQLILTYSGLKSTPLGLNYIANTVLILDFTSNSIQSIASMEYIKFDRLQVLHLYKNGITHLRPKFLIAPRLRSLNLENNDLVSLEDVTQYSWGASLSQQKYMAIYLRLNPWHCNGSLMWMLSNLYKFGNQIIYAKPGHKPYVKDVQRMVCKSPDARIGTTVVPKYFIERINNRIDSLGELAGKCFLHFASNAKNNLRSGKSMAWAMYLCQNRA